MASASLAAVTRRARRRGSEVNVGPVQRAASAGVGAALVALGLRRRTPGGAALALIGGDLLYRGATGYCHLLGALGIDTSRGAGRVEIQRSITVELPRAEVYAHWRDPETQRLVWRTQLVEITSANEQGAHWRAVGLLGRTLEWETRVVEEREGDVIRWDAADGDVPNDGSVEFRDAPGEYGTEVTLRVRFDPPAGALGDAAARLFDDAPKLVLEKALRRFKSLVESGEIASTEHNPSARKS